MKAYHYTVADRIASIDKYGIQLARVGVPDTEKAAVWFSTNPVYDATACKMGTRSLKEMVDLGMNPVRYVVDMPLKTWEEHKAKSGIDPVLAKSLEKVGKKVDSNPKDWYCVYEPIRKWLAIEAYQDGKWVELKDGDELLDSLKKAS